MSRVPKRACMMLVASLMGAGCSVLSSDSDRVEVRLRNNTNISFDSVRVLFPKNSEQYGELRAGTTSAFRAVDEAYGYAYIAAYADTAKFVLQPIDYVGEELLTAGRYTYRLGIGEAGSRYLYSELVIDQQ